MVSQCRGIMQRLTLCMAADASYYWNLDGSKCRETISNDHDRKVKCNKENVSSRLKENLPLHEIESA